MVDHGFSSLLTPCNSRETVTDLELGRQVAVDLEPDVERLQQLTFENSPGEAVRSGLRRRSNWQSLPQSVADRADLNRSGAKTEDTYGLDNARGQIVVSVIVVVLGHRRLLDPTL
jgi:hypothetical protein